MRPLLLLLLVTTNAALATPLVEAQWRLRGMDALEKIKLAGPNGHPNKIRNPPQRLEAMLNAAYAMHAARPELVHTTSTNGGDEFRLTLVTSQEQVFTLAYLYTADGSLSAARIEALPQQWTLFFAPDRLQASTVNVMEKRRAKLGASDGLSPPRPLIVNAPEGMLVFDLMDPFGSFVYERELNIPSTPPPAKEKATSPAEGAARPKEGR